MEPYKPNFAYYYDYLVHDCREAYATERDVEFLIDCIREHASIKVQKILDVGCGTGRYLVPLAKRGFRMTGLDNSPEMLIQCRKRLDKATSEANLLEQDLIELKSNEKYDALLCMNSVICYLVETEEILKALSLFKRALRPNGILVLEIWNIFTNTQLFGKTSSRAVQDDQVNIVINESHWFESFRSVLHGKLDVMVERNGKTETFTHEEVLRAMTVGEMVAYLKATGFGDISVYPRSDGSEGSPEDEELVFFAKKP